VLIIGGGVIGLAAIAVLRSESADTEVTAIVRHRAQAGAAHALGAHHVVVDDEHTAERLSTICGRPLIGRDPDRFVIDGFQAVVEAAVSESALALGCRFASPRSVVYLLGCLGCVPTDLTYVWLKELALVGSFAHGWDSTEAGPQHSFDGALDIIRAGGFPGDRIVTHTFELDHLQDAVSAARARTAGVLKVQLQPHRLGTDHA
jgi:threonine dehydrogenase-like Zn-dependent dehydrogenase